MATTGVLFLTATALPAMANDVNFTIGTNGAHHGLWSDSIDRLGACLGGSVAGSKLVVTIRPADGVGPAFSITDQTIGNGCFYTGNLSIPEDERYTMILSFDSPLAGGDATGSVGFYT